jgi:hypothetical protein
MKKISLFSVFSLVDTYAICLMPAGTTKTKVAKPAKITNSIAAQQIAEVNNTEVREPDLTIFSFQSQIHLI